MWAAAAVSAATLRWSTMEAVVPAKVLITAFMSRIADGSLAVTALVPLEVLKGLRATIGVRAVVAVVRVITIVNVSIEAARPVEPWASSDEDAIGKPVGP